ncbi:hypothetical protein HN51_011922, partial [Arachis hypogaea]
LNNIFNDQIIVNLLILWSTLLSKDICKYFIITKISTFIDSYYLEDFIEQKKINLSFWFRHFILDARQHLKMGNISTICELCKSLTEIKK